MLNRARKQHNWALLMVRMIERWFPCEDVTTHSRKGWGGGKSENGLFPWFASRPPAQAKAAVICSLLEWPEEDTDEQARLKDMVKEAMQGYNNARAEIVSEIHKCHPEGARLIDPFSGRGIIPAEAARLSVETHGVDYSPVATVASTLLADWPLRNWSNEPELPFAVYSAVQAKLAGHSRLLNDVAAVLEWVGQRHRQQMAEFYPRIDGRTPWAYLWAVTIPCVACGGVFPLTPNLKLRNPNPKKEDAGQSYRLIADSSCKTIVTEVHDGPPTARPTMIKLSGAGSGRGKAAICPFCFHVHTFAEHTRLRGEDKAGDRLLIVAEFGSRGAKKHYRTPSSEEIAAAEQATRALSEEPDFAPGLPAIPNESAENAYAGPRPIKKYGYKTFGDYSNPRQTLSFIRLARAIDDLYSLLITHGVSHQYAHALTCYASAALVRMLKFSTRGASLQLPEQAIHHIASSGSVVPMGNDYIEAGPYKGPGTWLSLSKSTISTLRRVLSRDTGQPATISRGAAQSLNRYQAMSMTAVVTDPPYDSLVLYSDSSNLFYVWLKRALCQAQPELRITSNTDGLQENHQEAIVVMGYKRRGDPRTPQHYNKAITASFSEARRLAARDGVVTIIFGHDDPDVWKRLLGAIHEAGLVLTGSWPARTEAGAALGKANIEVTLTLACRAAATNRPNGRLQQVRAEIRQEITARGSQWDDAGLEVLRDRRIAAYGPAMELAGRYQQVFDNLGQPVDGLGFLAYARRVVTELAGLKIGNMEAEDFDGRTRFVLSWTSQHARRAISRSEDRWERLTQGVTETELRGLMKKSGTKTRFAYSSEALKVMVGKPKKRVTDSDLLEAAASTDSVIDLALGVAACGISLSKISSFLAAASATEDEMLWAVINQLAADLPDNDRDGKVWAWASRNRRAIESGSEQAIAHHKQRQREQSERSAQSTLDFR